MLLAGAVCCSVLWTRVGRYTALLMIETPCFSEKLVCWYLLTGARDVANQNNNVNIISTLSQSGHFLGGFTTKVL
jgi:hypothetical protein